MRLVYRYYAWPAALPEKITGMIKATSIRCLFIYLTTVTAALSASVDSTALTLTNIHGDRVTFFANQDNQAVVFIFITTDCPISNSYAPEIRRIAKAYGERSIQITLVHVDTDLSNGDAIKHAKEYSLDEIDTIVVDRKHELVKLSQALITPQAAIFTSDKKLVYLGRINNLFSGYGDRRSKANIHDLRNALDEILAGKAISTPRTKAHGCYIPKK